MEIIKLTPENSAFDHICFAIADNKSADGYQVKNVWLNDRFKQGYVFRNQMQGERYFFSMALMCAWTPLSAPGYTMIDGFWVSGQYKEKVCGIALYQECVADLKDK